MVGAGLILIPICFLHRNARHCGFLSKIPISDGTEVVLALHDGSSAHQYRTFTAD